MGFRLVGDISFVFAYASDFYPPFYVNNQHFVASFRNSPKVQLRKCNVVQWIEMEKILKKQRISEKLREISSSSSSSSLIQIKMKRWFWPWFIKVVFIFPRFVCIFPYHLISHCSRSFLTLVSYRCVTTYAFSHAIATIVKSMLICFIPIYSIIMWLVLSFSLFHSFKNICGICVYFDDVSVKTETVSLVRW